MSSRGVGWRTSQLLLPSRTANLPWQCSSIRARASAIARHVRPVQREPPAWRCTSAALPLHAPESMAKTSMVASTSTRITVVAVGIAVLPIRLLTTSRSARENFVPWRQAGAWNSEAELHGGERAVGARLHRSGEPATELGVTLGDALDRVFEPPLHIDAGSLHVRSGAPVAAAQADGACEL